MRKGGFDIPRSSGTGGGGGGTVTSVGISAPNWLAVSGSPVTTSGTLALANGTGLTANFAVATDNSGNLGLIALTAAHIPWTTPGTIGSGTPNTGAFTTLGAGSGKFSIDVNGNITKINNVSLASWPGSNSAGALTNDGSGNLIWAGGSGISGSLTSGRVTVSSGASTVTDFANLVYSDATSGGLSCGVKHGSGTSNTNFGTNNGPILTTGDFNTFIGGAVAPSATTAGSNVLIGYQAGIGASGFVTGIRNVVIGYQASLEGDPDYSIAIGSFAVANGIVIGYNANTSGLHNNMLVVGSSSQASSDGCQIFGFGCTSSHTGAILIGDNLTSGATYDYQMDGVHFWFGPGGRTLELTTDVDFNVSNATGSNAVGASVIFNAGAATGNAAPGNFRIQTSIVGSSGSTLQTLNDRLIIRGKPTALTNSSATSLFDVALPTLTGAGGTVDFTIFATDGTDVQTYSGSVAWNAVNKAGVYTTSTSILGTAAISASGVSTLTASFGITTGSNIIHVQCTPVSSLTPTTLQITYAINNHSQSAITLD